MNTTNTNESKVDGIDDSSSDVSSETSGGISGDIKGDKSKVKWVQCLGTLVQMKKGVKVWFHDDVEELLDSIIKQFYNELDKLEQLKTCQSDDNDQIVKTIFEGVDKTSPFHMTRVVLGAVSANSDLLDDSDTTLQNPAHFYDVITDKISVYSDILDDLTSKLDDYFFLIAVKLRETCKNGHGVSVQHILNVMSDLNEPVETHAIDKEWIMFGDELHGIGMPFTYRRNLSD